MTQSIVRVHLAFPCPFPAFSHWLTLEELRTFERITAPQRRHDWLAGRRAAKELIRCYLLETVGLELPPSQIRILNDAHGAPYADLPSWPPSLKGRGSSPPRVGEGLGERFCISIAHSAGHGLAGLAPHGSIGVDLQRIRPVRSDLAERVLTDHERTQFVHYFVKRESEGLLVFWALKEAAIKAQRTRPAPALREIAVRLTEPGHAEISLRTQRLKAQWGQWGEFIWAWAFF
uniref:4'-phosphopantetheinyl transferase domain-containing protein n=1 Tax=Acetithermum autotrophicum TaxID=1446466 RepID=H5STN0_ACEAU|nr:hypothetical protein HGMM_OP4C488 [Candidatus Acetothermum autotrophicum]